MNAEIISIGDELLIGQVVNTNASWMAEELNLIGVKVVQITAIEDEEAKIHETLNAAGNRADIILITGGLGPTRDDITKKALCSYFDSKLVFNEEAFENIKKLFESRGRQVTEVNRQQAELPEKCIPVKNIFGTAYGMWFEQENKIVVSMPGVPYEMQRMMQDSILPMIADRFNTPEIIHKTILTQGIGESSLAEMIEQWEDNLPQNFKLAYLPSPGRVRLRLSVIGEDREQIERQLGQKVEELKSIISDRIYGYDLDKLEELAGLLLREQHRTLATAESCTGGYLAHLITSIAGSSNYFKGSVVAYSNEVKINVLGVNAQDLIECGAVSEAVVRQMAAGVKEKFEVDYAIATSGVAGPAGGSEEKPVGTVWIAIASPVRLYAKKFMFGENRQYNIEASAISALNLLRKIIFSENMDKGIS